MVTPTIWFKPLLIGAVFLCDKVSKIRECKNKLKIITFIFGTNKIKVLYLYKK